MGTERIEQTNTGIAIRAGIDHVVASGTALSDLVVVLPGKPADFDFVSALFGVPVVYRPFMLSGFCLTTRDEFAGSARFVAIAADGPDPLALDDEGRVWRYIPADSQQSRHAFWSPLTTHRAALPNQGKTPRG